MIVTELEPGKYVVEFTLDELVILDRFYWDTIYSRCELLKTLINDRFNKLTNPIEKDEG